MRRLFILLTLLISLLFADKSLDIDSYISRIKEASPETRVQLMNEFKQKVAQMNKEERLKSIQQIQAKMKMSSPQVDHTSMQSQHIENINTYQNMNQKKTSDKLSGTYEHKTDMKHMEFR